MTNPKRSERNTEKNPWAMVNRNYKFGKSLLCDGDLKKAAHCTRKLHTFCGSQMMILTLWSHFGPGPMHGLRYFQTDSSSYLCNSVICTISSTWMLWI
jgi:hypothetical protein